MAIERRHADPSKTVVQDGRYYPPYGDGVSGKMSHDKRRMNPLLWKFMNDIRYEPDWRREAEWDAAFYDGDQLKTKTLQRMKELGIPPMVVNLIAPIVDATTGWEEIARANLKCIPETQASYEVARAMNVKYKEALRLTKFDREVGFQFKDTVKTGLGWLEVVRESDPFLYPYRVGKVPWRQMYVDYKSRREDYSDKRYVVRRQWYDADVLKEHLPNHKKLINSLIGGQSDSWFSEWDSSYYTDVSQALAMHADQEIRFTLEEDEWRNTERKRLALYEIVYFKTKQVECLRFPDNMTIELDETSPAQLQAIASGQAKYVKGATKVWHQAYYLGPAQVMDRELEINKCHYIPMVAKRKDNDGSPYGMIRNARSPQEGYNARHSRMLYDLSSRKYVVDDDAVDSHSRTAKELNKVNSYVVLKGDRMGEGLAALPTIDATPVAFQLMEVAKQNVPETMGPGPEFTGQLQYAGQSGVGIDQLIHQTQQVLGTLVGNYRDAKLQGAQILFDLMTLDMRDMENVEIEDDESDGRMIVLNSREADGTRTNDTLIARVNVALGETPATQNYLQQKLQELTEIIKSMPPELQSVFADLVVKSYAPEDQDEILERIRQVTGFGQEPKDPQKREELQQQQQAQAQMQQRAAEAEIALKEADVELKLASAMEKRVRAQKMEESDTDLTEAKTLVELAKAGDVGTQAELKERETQAKLIEGATRLEKERNAERSKSETKQG